MSSAPLKSAFTNFACIVEAFGILPSCDDEDASGIPSPNNSDIYPIQSWCNGTNNSNLSNAYITKRNGWSPRTIPSCMFLQLPKSFGFCCVSPQWSEFPPFSFGLFSSLLGDFVLLGSAFPCRIFEEYVSVLDTAFIYSSRIG